MICIPRLSDPGSLRVAIMAFSGTGCLNRMVVLNRNLIDFDLSRSGPADIHNRHNKLWHSEKTYINKAEVTKNERS